VTIQRALTPPLTGPWGQAVATDRPGVVAVKPVAVSEPIGAGIPHLVDACDEPRPGDTRRYDKRFGKGTQ
jgi:hypothetical protein